MICHKSDQGTVHRAVCAVIIGGNEVFMSANFILFKLQFCTAEFQTLILGIGRLPVAVQYCKQNFLTDSSPVTGPRAVSRIPKVQLPLQQI